MKKTWKKSMMVVTASIMLMTSVATSHAQWTQFEGNWYYVQSNGSYAAGWLKEGNQWYYLDENGVMKTGWQQIGGKWYYLSSNGAMKTGWLQEGNQWYYLDGSGAMKTNWQQIGGKWYYFNSNGVMASNTTIDGYYIGEDGVWKEKGNESENDLFYSYLKEKIIPNVGLSYLGHFDSMKNFRFDLGKKFSVDSKYIGLISTYIGDINYDGVQEMIVFYTKQENDSSNIADEITLYFDLYTIKDGKVSFLKNLGNVYTRWYIYTDYHQDLKIGIKEYKNHTYLFINNNEFLGDTIGCYYDLTDLNNISYVNYERVYYGSDGSSYAYIKTLNNKTEKLLQVDTDDYENYTFTGKYSSKEEVENAIQKELDSVGLGKDRELNSQKVLELSATMYDNDGCTMGINLTDYTDIRDTLNVK